MLLWYCTPSWYNMRKTWVWSRASTVDPATPAGSELPVCTMQHLSCSMHSCRTYKAPLSHKISVLQPCLHYIRMTRPSHACACTCRHDSTIIPLMVSTKEKGEQEQNKGTKGAMQHLVWELSKPPPMVASSGKCLNKACGLCRMAPDGSAAVQCFNLKQ